MGISSVDLASSSLFSYHSINCFRLYLVSITSDVTVDYNAPLPCVLVFFPRIGTLVTPGAGGDDQLALIINFVHV